MSKANTVSQPLHEITLKAFTLGALLSIVMAASNAYLGLKLGISISASIPSAVLSMVILGLFKKSNILENNIVQTTASAGEVVAMGAAFTLPALLMMGYWQSFSTLDTFLITASGGTLGVLFTSLMRQALLSNPDLHFPEGKAAAEVLKSKDDAKGHMDLLLGGLLAGFVKLLQDGVGFLKNSIYYFASPKGILIGFESGLSLILLGAGYIIGVEVGLSILLGGILAWCVGLPILSILNGLPEAPSAYEAAYSLWSSHLRIVGVGMMVFGGVWMIPQLLKPLILALSDSFRKSARAGGDLPTPLILIGLAVFITLCSWAALSEAGAGSFQTPYVLTVVGLVLFLGAFSSSLGGYMAGLVGSSNSPISGITILAILTISLALVLLEQFGASAPNLAALAIILGCVIACASAVSTNTLQDLKTGEIVGATPWKQQVMLIVGVIVSSAFIAPIFQVLLKAYGFVGVESSTPIDITNALSAPKAALLGTLVDSIFSDQFEWTLFLIGGAISVVFIFIDYISKRNWNFHMPVLAVGLGVYMPLEITVPIFIGGLIHSVVHKKGAHTSGRGTLFAAGLIAGEAIMGIGIAFLIATYGFVSFSFPGFDTLQTILSVGIFAVAAYWLYRRGAQ